jgi:hypothetical protein
MHKGIQMKTLLAICVVAVAAVANVGCLSDTDPQTSQSEAISAVETSPVEILSCPGLVDPGDGFVFFCSNEEGSCCCDRVDMLDARIVYSGCGFDF